MKRFYPSPVLSPKIVSETSLICGLEWWRDMVRFYRTGGKKGFDRKVTSRTVAPEILSYEILTLLVLPGGGRIKIPIWEEAE